MTDMVRHRLRLRRLTNSGPDRLSALPDDILHDILARLPLDDAVRSAVLARRWRGLWSTNPVLRLTSPDDLSTKIPLETYINAIDRCVRACSAQKLVAFYFELDDQWPVDDISQMFDVLLRFAAVRKVEALSMLARVEYVDDELECVPTPPSLFRCRFLRSLRLVACSISCAPSRKGENPSAARFPFMTDLSLLDVEIDDDQFSRLLATCPRLQSLSLSNCILLTKFVINSPTLERFSLYDHDMHIYAALELEVVHAPKLKWLGIHSDLSFIRSLSAAVNLAEVTLFGWMNQGIDYRIQCTELLCRLPPVESLAVNQWFLLRNDVDVSESPPVVFLNIKELHICVREPFVWSSLRALARKLSHCPALEKLFIHVCILGDCSQAGDHWRYKFKHQGGEDGEVGDGCMFPCLKKFTIVNFSGTDEEMKLVELVMSKAVVLETVYLFYQKEILESKLNEVSEKINLFHRASPVLHISLHELNHGRCRTAEWCYSLLNHNQGR